jgi:hypothetical protein
VAHDGVFTDDPSEAVRALEEQVLAKKLLGGRAGLELRPVPDRGIGTGGLARASAATHTDIRTIWRAFVLKPRGRVAFVPPRGITPEDAGRRLAAAGIVGPDGNATKESYELRFDADTPPARLVEHALSGLRALGSAQGNVMWSWLTRARDQVPR